MDKDEIRFQLYDRLDTEIIDWINDHGLDSVEGTKLAFEVVSDLATNLEDDLNAE